MVTVRPLDPPQLSTTLEGESHRDPTSAGMENPGPPALPAPPAPLPSGPGEQGAPCLAGVGVAAQPLRAQSALQTPARPTVSS